MHAILVSVDYTDILKITLPYNRHHFKEVTVITSLDDWENVDPVCDANDAVCYSTDLFYEDGADFNKWRALEWGLEYINSMDPGFASTDGWICLMDADVLWPKQIRIVKSERGKPITTESDPNRLILRPGYLCSPLRRMLVDFPRKWYCHGPNPPIPIYQLDEISPDKMLFTKQLFPEERHWHTLPIHPNVNEWAGYTQIFHYSDPVLGNQPWHQIDWRHAGGADSFFQSKWPANKKVRPPFEVLHLGKAGVNWCGRATPYIDTHDEPVQLESRRSKLREYMKGRVGKSGDARYLHERLP